MARKSTTGTTETQGAKESVTRIYILRGRSDETTDRLIDAKSETAALIHVADALYSIAVAKPKDVADAYKAGAIMEVAP